jgi:hypothetical protein
MAPAATAFATVPVELVEGSTEVLPLEDNTVGTIVST